MENSMEVPKNLIELPYDTVILLLGKYQEKKNTHNSNRHMYPSVRYSTIYYSQDMEAN